MRNKQKLEEMYLQTAENLGWKREKAADDLVFTTTLPTGNNFGFYVIEESSILNQIDDFLFGWTPDAADEFYTKEEIDLINSKVNDLLNALVFTNINARPFDPATDELLNYRSAVASRVQEEFYEFLQKNFTSKECLLENADRLTFYSEMMCCLQTVPTEDLFSTFDVGLLWKFGPNLLETLYNKYLEVGKSSWYERFCSIADFLDTLSQ